MIVMGMPVWAWIVFYVAVLVMLIVDLKMFGRKGQHEVNVGEAMRMTVVWIAVSLLFCVGIYYLYPVETHVTGEGDGVPGRLPDREVTVDGQPVRIPYALLILWHREEIPA